MEFLKAGILIKTGNMSGLKKSTLSFIFLLLNFYGYASNLNKFFTPLEIKKASTATKINYLTNVEKEIFVYVNLARMQPKKFLAFFKSYVLKQYNGTQNLKSNKYYTSLVNDLNKQKPTHALMPDFKMWQLAKCWAKEAGEGGIVSHDRTGCKEGYNGECCSYGKKTAIEIVMQLLVDEGVPSLGHRKICLSSEYGLLGVSQQAHKQWATNTVMDFTYRKEYAAN